MTDTELNDLAAWMHDSFDPDIRTFSFKNVPEQIHSLLQCR